MMKAIFGLERLFSDKLTREENTLVEHVDIVVTEIGENSRDNAGRQKNCSAS